MWTVLLGFLLISGLVAYFLSRGQKGKRGNPPAPKRIPARRPPSPDESPALPLENRDDLRLDQKGLLNLQTRELHSFAEAKKRVQEGMEVILSAPPDISWAAKKPLSLEEVSPGVLRTVREQIGGLKEFKNAYQLSKVLDDPYVNISRLSRLIVTDPSSRGRC